MSNQNKMINDVPLKEAENKTERALLGFVEQEAERIQYGVIRLEVRVHNGKLTNLTTIPSKKSNSLHNLESKV